MRQMSTKIIDGLEELGGQLTALYPDKYIYDMPGFPRVLARDLVAGQVEQALQYGAVAALGQKVVGLDRNPDGVWILTTEKGHQHLSRTVVITAGAGSFQPRKLPVAELDHWEGRGVYYFVRDLNAFRGRKVLIVGGGDSALDWALALETIAERVTLIHRRDRFRAHEESVDKLSRSSVDVRVFWELAEVRADERLRAVRIFDNRSNESRWIDVDAIILSLGFVADLGPVRSWGVVLDHGAIVVNTRMETNLPGVYAAGDVVTYDGKLKLIATGVAESAIAVNYAKTFIDPSSRAFPGHSSEMSR
jgi:thioredoxin reductase (NADPH)